MSTAITVINVCDIALHGVNGYNSHAEAHKRNKSIDDFTKVNGKMINIIFTTVLKLDNCLLAIRAYLLK